MKRENLTPQIFVAIFEFLAYTNSMNQQFPPLYPQEAYSEQNNARAFMQNQNNQFEAGNNFNQAQNNNSSPLASILGGNGSTSPILPLLLKMMSGNGSSPLGDILKSSGDSSSPLMNILSNLSGNKKNSSPQETCEKEFPEQ